jgi:hypothetical protein
MRSCTLHVRSGLGPELERNAIAMLAACTLVVDGCTSGEKKYRLFRVKRTWVTRVTSSWHNHR